MSLESYEEIELQRSDEVKEILESRHVLDDEIKMIIFNAESTGEKLYQAESGKYLAKMRISNATFYVEYSAAQGKTYIVHTAYSHRAELEE